jgi:hypothetical protein
MATQRPPGAPSPPSKSVTPPFIEEVEPTIDETEPPQPSPLAALPRLDETAPPQPPPLAAPRPPPRAAPPQKKPIVMGPPIDETAPPQRSPLAAALPFRHASVERARLENARTVGFAMPPGGEDPAKAAANRAGAPGSALQGAPGAAASTGHFGLTLEQYAALCAEVAVFPLAAEAIFARYGLASQKDRLTADAAWQDRLRADPAMMQRWQSLYLHYHEYFHRTPRR